MVKEIKTNLVNKSYLFESLYIAEKTGFPILLIGERGVGKTQAVLDYMQSNGFKNLFAKQLSPETRADELLGYISIPALKEGRIERIGGLNEADVILIDEVDKASSQVRNLLLSVMRERKIFDGEKFIDCNYKLLVGTANRIPDDEDDIIFIDRFILKQNVERISLQQIGSLLDNRIRTYKFYEKDIEVNGDIIRYKDNLEIKYEVNVKEISSNIIKEIYKYISDRTAVAIPKIITTLIALGYDQYDATLRALELLGNFKAERIYIEYEIAKKITKIYKDYKKDPDNFMKNVEKEEIIKLMNSKLYEIDDNISSERRDLRNSLRKLIVKILENVKER